jgi:membrane protease subunit (stomatin/prohibitin family)
MGLIRAAFGAVGGTLADQWVDFITAPQFDEQTLVAPGIVQQRNAGRGSNTQGSASIISDGSRITVPENTALIVTDGGRIVSFSSEPGYFVFRNDGQPSIYTGGSVRDALIRQSWERFKFGGQPGGQQLAFFVNLREIRNNRFGTPGPLPYRDFSLVPPGSVQAPVLRLMARGLYSVRIADPILFFRNFLPANARSYTLADQDASDQLFQEFITAFQAALQALSRTTDIASLAMHGPELAKALTEEGGPEGSWLERFGLEVISVAVAAIEYDQASRELMDKLNQGLMLGGAVGNAYTQTTVADAALAAGQAGGGGALMGVGMGVGAIGGTLAGLQQPVAPVAPAPAPAPAAPAPAPAPEPAAADPVVVLGQLKALLDQGLITAEQFSAKQQEILGRM